MRGLAARLRALFRRTTTDAELEEELAYHLDRETERNVTAGMSAPDARDAARRSLGNLTAHTEQAREAFGWTWLEHLGQDATYGWRALRRSRAFTTVAALSLALGIGANSMIFGVTYSVLFEPLPLPHPEQLALLERVTGTETDRSFSNLEVDALRDTPGLAGLTAARDADNSPIVVNGERSFVTVDFIDADFFATTGLSPYRGRGIDPADVTTSAPVAVISQAFAERMFGTAERALGREVRVYDVPMSIVGVAPAAFRGLEYPGWFTIAVPVSLAPMLGLPDYRSPTSASTTVVARFADGVARTQAEAALNAAFQRCCPHASPERLATVGMTRGIGGGKDDARNDYAPLLYILLAGAGVVLIIACANVASLLLVRASAREREIAVRMSLGASRSRIIRQLLTESLLLGALGGVAAVPFAAWGTLGVERMIPANLSVYADIVRWHPKPALLVFTALIAVACVTLFGLAPAFRATRTSLSVSLRTGGRGSVGGGRRWLDRGVVIAQLAFALLLVSAASLLVTTLRNLAREDGGFATSGVTMVSIETRGTRYERDGIVPLQAEMLRRVRAVPGVEQAGMSTLLPIAGGRRTTVEIDVDGTVIAPSTIMSAVTPGYLAAVGIRLRAGRDLTDHDDASSQRVAIISESVAKRAFPGRSAIGESIRISSDSTYTFRVIGIARDTKLWGLRSQRIPMVYASTLQTGSWPFLGLAVRIPDGAEVLTRRVLTAVDDAAPGVRIRKVSTMRGDVSDSMFTDRLAASIATLFGALALLLAAIGIYGVIAFNVARRTNEIGVRMALGATRADILALVLRNALTLVVLAVALGAPLAFAAGRAMRSQLFGVSAHDPVLLLVTLGVLVAMALVATSIPARRATRIDPLVALRSD